MENKDKDQDNLDDEIGKFLYFLSKNFSSVPLNDRTKWCSTTSVVCSKQHNQISYIVDTVFVNDLQCYETAISVDDSSWVVVERYATEGQASSGHEYIVNACKDGLQFVLSIQTCLLTRLY